jgi:hypothetical protein
MGPMASISSPFTQAAMHIANILRQVGAQDREPLLRTIIDTSPSLPFASEVLRWSRILSGDDVAPDARPLTPTVIAGLEDALSIRISASAAEAPLFHSMTKYAPSLYYDWQRGAGAAVVEQHLQTVCTGNVQNCLALIRAFMPTAWSMETGLPVGSQVERNTYDSITGLVPATVIVETLASAFSSTVAAELPADTSGMDQDERIAMRFVHIHQFVESQTTLAPDEEQPPVS